MRFELELKHRQTKLVQDYLFNNQLDIFEHQLVSQYFKYSERVLCLDYEYTDWIINFKRKCQRVNPTYPSLFTSYLENRRTTQDEEERFFHLLQFLSFIKNLELNLLKDCKKHKIKEQNYYYILNYILKSYSSWIL